MSAIPQTVGWQAGFMNILPCVQTHAKIRFRKLPAEKRDEAIQETIAAACMHYQLAAVQGRLHAVRPGTLADFAVRHVCTGRRVGGKQNGAKDVLSPVCQRRHGVNVISVHAHRSGTGTDGWQQIAMEDRTIPIPDLAAFRIDFAYWLKSLTQRDRRIINAFTDGEGTFAVAERFGLTPGRVSQLRRKFEREWLAYQGELEKFAA
jgi:hypothetical protein